MLSYRKLGTASRALGNDFGPNLRETLINLCNVGKVDLTILANCNYNTWIQSSAGN